MSETSFAVNAKTTLITFPVSTKLVIPILRVGGLRVRIIPGTCGIMSPYNGVPYSCFENGADTVQIVASAFPSSRSPKDNTTASFTISCLFLWIRNGHNII